MNSLPDVLVQYILSYMSNAMDVASCNNVSRQWKESTPFLTSLYFPRNLFDNLTGQEDPDTIIGKMIASIHRLENLVVYCPFSSSGLDSWLLISGATLKNLELRMDSIIDHRSSTDSSLKLDYLNRARNLESLKLWGVLMTHPPNWETFQNLKNLEIVGAKIDGLALSDVLGACPNLTDLLILGCEGLRSVSIDLPLLETCKLDFYGQGNCSLVLKSPRIQNLEVQGCSWISVKETQFLKNLSISNNSGRVHMVDFGKLVALESLSMRGVQWCWDAISKMLQMASEVKHLFMKVEFTGEFEALLPFPEIDFVEFFNSHPKLQRFDIHGAMFAALCQKNSLKNVDSRFAIPCLEEVVITVRSPLNAEQKMSTLESLIKYGINLKKMVIKILQMKSNHSSADDFFEEICKFRYMNQKIVSIE